MNLSASLRSLFLAAAAFTLTLTLTGCTATGPALDDRVASPEPTPSPSVVAARNALKEEFGAFLRQLYPTYNDIYILDTGSKSSETWIELAAIHPLFSPFTFASGPQKGIIQNWVYERQQRLIEAQVNDVSVGVSAGSRGDKTYFEENLSYPPSRPILTRAQ